MIGVCPTAGGVRHHQGETAGSEAVAVAVAAVEAAVAVKARAACASERRKVEGSRDKNPGVRWAATAGRAAFSPGPPGPPMHIISQTRHGQHTMSHSSGTQQGQNPRKPGPPGPPWKPCAPLPMVHLRDERRAREWSRRALPRAAVVRASTFLALMRGACTTVRREHDRFRTEILALGALPFGPVYLLARQLGSYTRAPPILQVRARRLVVAL